MTSSGETISSREQTFEMLALPHMNDLFRTASAILGRRTEAEDAVQEAYLQAWKSFDRFMVGTNCRAWMFKILFHVISHQRRKWLSRYVLREPKTFENATAYTPPVAQDLTDEEILSAFRKLPAQYADVVLLADVQEFSYKEIREALGIPIGTVMSRLSRGRHLLREQLGNAQPAVKMRAAHAAADRVLEPPQPSLPVM